MEEFCQKKNAWMNSIKMALLADLPPVLTNKPPKSKNINFVYSLRPIIYVSRMFGLLPFSIVCDTNGVILNAQVTAFNMTWFLIAICTYLSMALVCFQNVKVYKNLMSKTLLIGDAVILTLYLINSAKAIIMDMFNRFRFIEILQKISFFDAEVI